jgi:hypothetical protein
MLVAALGSPRADGPQDPLLEARVQYNQRNFDQAIQAAERARELPGQADGADLVAGRAYLERYRQTASTDDLVHAREHLRRINPEGFGLRERVELGIGLGAALYYEGFPGAAAGVFESVLEDSSGLDTGSREGVLDWWASSIDREARPRPDLERQTIYQALLDRMHLEIATNPASTVAAYWIVAAAAGQGDWEAAWGAAQAAWVRAPLMGERGIVLRADVDRLVREGIAPERAKTHARPPDILLTEWEAFKEKWARPSS